MAAGQAAPCRQGIHEALPALWACSGDSWGTAPAQGRWTAHGAEGPQSPSPRPLLTSAPTYPLSLLPSFNQPHTGHGPEVGGAAQASEGQRYEEWAPQGSGILTGSSQPWGPGGGTSKAVRDVSRKKQAHVPCTSVSQPLPLTQVCPPHRDHPKHLIPHTLPGQGQRSAGAGCLDVWEAGGAGQSRGIHQEPTIYFVELHVQRNSIYDPNSL